jgi:hypothetical protein
MAGFETFGRHTPRGDRVTPAGSPPFTTTVWVVYWIHHNTPDGGAHTAPSSGTRFA